MPWVVVEVDGRRQRVAVARQPKGVWVGWRGGQAFVSNGVAAADKGPDGDGRIVAPLTGKLVRVEVAPGDEVAVDDLLIVLEAMKMEYRLTAPVGGTVRAVHGAVGDLVEQGTVLVELEE